MSKLSKPIDTVSIILTITGMLKTGAVVLAAVLLQWARAKQKLAENKQAAAETDLKIKQDQDKVEDKYEGKDADSVIREYLDELHNSSPD